MAYDNIKREIISMLKRMPNKQADWDNDLLPTLKAMFNPKSVSNAKSQLISEGCISQEIIDGRKIITLIKDPYEISSPNTFDEEFFLANYEYKIKKYFKEKLSTEGPEWNVFDVEEFTYHFIDCLEINDKIVNNPYECRRLINEIYKEAYEEIFGGVPESIVRIRNLRENMVKISELQSKHVGKLIEFEGMIIQAGKPMSRVAKGAFECPRCGRVKYVELDIWDDPINVAKELSCPECDIKGFRYLESESEHVNFQEIYVQQPLELSKDGKQHTITVFAEGFPPIYNGKVKITGVAIKKKIKGSVSKIFIRAFNIEQLDKIDIEITEEDIEKIRKVAKDKNVIEKLANYMFREIKGHEIVKKAIFLQQIKGITFLNGKTLKRGDINILLITDPGIGKTTIMRKLELYGNKYVSGATTSVAGLAAAVVRGPTEFGEGYILKPGALVLADGNTCCVDEIGVNKELTKALLEAMESQTVHVNKGGFDAVLPARCAILAACNPKRGRFDRNKTVIEQIELSAPMFSRFDLIFPLMDIPDKNKDAEIIDHIIDEINRAIDGKKEKLVINGVEIDDEFILKYILHARTYMPKISKEAKEVLKNYYVEMRKLGEGDNPIPITARQAEAIIRLAGAIAKAKLKKIVGEDDVMEAIEIMDYCLKQIAYDPESGSIDIDKIAGTPKSKRDKVEKVLSIVKEISDSRDDGLAPEEDIKDKAKDMGLSEKDVDDALSYLKKVGDIHSPKPGYWQLI
ncbi:hypothetical protein QIT38_gp43 [Methanocaldococcus fervens tailed virus 1]|uniref:MCM family protein n=2 Tax=root TaxID=1 RepID=C7P5K4_METFA|nr:minichromosome maintenance protein MCM [Methanocaldococcus fervens]YP_010772338.1 hypothetical protein QIT38_gp43 [Methanocaldococcus fervens tailed virus 1]ACV25382.1 MCM family protein [Methanocaldococcus fervens AG86]QNO11511.1 hypothetical protein [Methanocaldococcus fervens tailed virus 1]